MMLTYPKLCADVLQGKPLQRKRICRMSGDFHERIAGLVREVIKWKRGDHLRPDAAGLESRL